MRTLPFLVFFLFIISIKVNAQEKTGSISGTVSEEKSGESVISLTVAIYADTNFTNQKPLYGVYTNKFGYYSIPKIEAGEYYLVAKGIGYSPYISKFALNEGEQLRYNIKIKSEDIRLQEITVEASVDESPTSRISAITVSPQFIKKMPSIGGETDIFRTLQLLPGVQQSTELSSGLYVRGGSPDQNLYLLDGVIVYNPVHLGGFLGVFNADALNDIKLIKGAFPAEYGGRLSSVLDMTMKEGTQEKISGSGGVSMISSRLTVEGPITEKSTFMISGRRMYLDVLTYLFSGGDDDIPVYYFYDLNAKYNYKISETDRLFVSAFLCRDVLKAPEAEDDNFDIFWGNKTANVRWMHIVSPEVFTNFSLIYTDYLFGTDIDDKHNKSKNFISESRIRDLMLRAEVQYFPSQKHKIKSGFESIWHNFRSKASADFSEDYFETFFATKDLTALEASIYIQDEWDISDVFSTNIGGRAFYFQEGNYFSFEPRLSGSYKLDERTWLKSSVALAHQFLHLIVRNDITLPTDLWFPSTEKIKPSRSWQAVLGVEHLLRGGEYMLTAELYYKDMQNLYEYKDDAEFTMGIPLENQFTRGKGTAYGLELFLNKRVGSFTGWLGYTLAWTNRTFKELNNGKTFPPRYDRRHDINLVLAYKFGKKWELGATWVYGTGQAYTMPTGTYRFDEIGSDWGYSDYYSENYQYTSRNGSRLPAFHKMDLNFIHYYSWFGLPFQLSINLYNVYNRKNPFAWYIDYDYKWNGNDYTEKKVLKQVTLFPFFPTFGISFQF